MSKKLLIPILIFLLAALACGETAAPEATVPPPNAKPDAKEAIQTYARDVLGLEIPSLWAGGTAGDISLPAGLQEDVDLAVSLSGQTYLGLWTEGAAMLAFGNGEVSGDFTADIEDGTVAVFAVRKSGAPPANADAALNLILETYPNLSRYAWEEVPDEAGYRFNATNPENFGIQSWSLELTGTTLKAGVTGGVANQNLVWVVTASGALSKPFQP